MVSDALERIFNPDSIAVIGATDRVGSVGLSLVKNLTAGGYKGTVHLVNLNGKEILGIQSVKSVLDIKESVDLAIIVTPAKAVPGIIEDCGRKGVKGAVIISAGFKEAGKEGDLLVEKMLKSAKKYSMRILGPNCLGFLNPSLSLNASFSSRMPLKGRIAFISQSGAMVTSILDWSHAHNVGFSYFASIGSMIDIGFHDLIDYFGSDPDTDCILIYMESLSEARKFMSAARAFSRNKPIIVLKVGKSIEGARAALSHTGSMTGNDRVFDAAFRRAGIIRVSTIQELFGCAQALSMQRRPKGNRLAIITNAGGPGVAATDFLVEHGGELATLADNTKTMLKEVLPITANTSDPIDILGDATPKRYKDAFEICLRDKDVDGIVVILTPQFMTDPSSVAKNLVSVAKGSSKTVLAAFMGEEDVSESKKILKKGSIPEYDTPEEAVLCFLNMYSYSKNLELLYEAPASVPHAFVPDIGANDALLADVAKDGRFILTEYESKQFLKNYGIPVPESFVVKSAEEAEKISSKVGFPLVMKVLSSDILHKTDVGGVKLGINTKEAAMQAYNMIMESVSKANPKALIKGVLVEKMYSKKYELLIGSKKDPIFGPAIVFGMGGVAVDVFKDTNVALPPLNMALSKRLIEETKIYQLLKGYRGMKAVDLESIHFLLYKFSYLLVDFPQILEIDINPFGVDDSGGVVLDAKVMLDKDAVGISHKDYSHLVISPYPKEYVRHLCIDGEELILRPIRPEDEPLEAELFGTFSEETKRLRFFIPIKDVTHDLLVRYTQIDYDREISIIAEAVDIGGRKKMLGFARLVADSDNDCAQFAIVVGDPWQNKGIGSIIADYILEIAKDRGIKKVYAYFSKNNTTMKHMFEKRGFIISDKGSDLYAELVLTE